MCRKVTNGNILNIHIYRIDKSDQINENTMLVWGKQLIQKYYTNKWSLRTWNELKKKRKNFKWKIKFTLLLPNLIYMNFKTSIELTYILDYLLQCILHTMQIISMISSNCINKKKKMAIVLRHCGFQSDTVERQLSVRRFGRCWKIFGKKNGKTKSSNSCNGTFSDA